MAHSKLKYPIGLLSENIQESIIADWQKRRASIYYFHVM
jgi:hypothetical protein